MNNIVDTHGNPVDADDYEIVKPWFWQRMSTADLSLVIFTSLMFLNVIFWIVFFIIDTMKTDKRMDLLLTETSLQLQAVADGCLNTKGE